MIVDIFIRTCSHDREYLNYCLKSIDKFCSGFRSVIVIPKDEHNGYLKQQIDKLSVDLFSNASHFLIVDSDTLFTCPVTPETYLVEGKPIWLHTPWTPEMLEVPGLRAWKDVMTAFFRNEPPSEMMRRLPFFVPRTLTEGIREYCLATHGKTIEQYVLELGKFSEFNIMGYFAWLFRQNDFHWVDTSKDPLPELTVRQFWSHDPIYINIHEINNILK